MRRSTPLLLMILLALPLSAQGWIEPDRPVGPMRDSPAVERVNSDVRVTINGRVARFEVTERFRNTGRGIAEGTYLYPMPGEAVFSDFSLFQGEQELRGEMMNAEHARTIYERIVRQLKDPALLTLVGHGLVRAQVFPIQPGETRTVILRYTHLLPRDGDAMRLRYAAGSRGDAPVTMNVQVARESEFATAYSPTHPIDESREGGDLRIRVSGQVRGDVELVLPFRRGLIGGTVITHAQPGEDGYALLFLAPPPSTSEAEIPRDLTFVVDISGSMSGGKIEQARAALRQALADLRPMDRFRLIAFSSGVREFREGWTPVTPAFLNSARRFINGLAATGGTNIAGALDAALSARTSASRMSLIVFVTDGLPSVGEQEPDRIAANAAGRIGRHRVFTFGVGSDVNTYLLDRLAVEGRGSASYVAPDADVSDAVGSVLTKLSRPALVDLRIVSAPVRFIDQAPAVLPDLFYGEELVVLSRFRGNGTGPVVIEGSRNGRRERFEIRGTFRRHEDDNRYVPQLWAARRIGELTRQIRIEGSTPELIREIRDLGLKHGVLTEYTSYLVQEPGVLASREERPLPQVAAPAAREQTGRAAFDAAKSTASMASSNTVAEAEIAVRQRGAQLGERRLGAGQQDAGELRRGGGRMFTLRAGVWTDVNHHDSLRVTTIAPFSRAYFDLVAARPAMREALAVGSPILIAGRRVSLRVSEGGINTWDAGAMTRFLQEFDGQ